MGAITDADEPRLPPGFRWEKASQHEVGAPTALIVDGEEVARMMERLDGSWFVLIERQRPVPLGEQFSPLVSRNCSSFDQGRRGTAMWAARHEARIRAQVAEKIARRPRHMGGRK